MDGLSLDNPWAWERYRLDTPRDDLIARLRLATCPLAPIRLAEVLIHSSGIRDELYEGLTILKTQSHPLGRALLIGANNRLTLWHDAYHLATNWNHPVNDDPIIQEAAFLAFAHGSMAASALKDDVFAARLLGRAEMLHTFLKLKSRDIFLRTEVERVNNNDGRGNPTAIREIIKDTENDHQHTANIYNLAESIASRGQYRNARSELRFTAKDDSKAIAMRAFYSSMLGEPFEDDGSQEEYMRLARAISGVRVGNFDLENLDFTHNPQATYGRILMLESVHRAFPSAARRNLPSLPIPGMHDQKVWWVINRLGALSRGIPVQDAHLIYDVWRDALCGLWSIREILSPTRAGFYSDRTLLLASLPGAPDHLLSLRRDMPLLTGEKIIYHGEEIRASGRIGGVLIAEAINPNMPNVKPLYGDEPGRWPIRINALIKNKEIPFAPVNPGYSIRAALHIRTAMQTMGRDTTEADIVVDRLMCELSKESRAMVYAGLGGDVLETKTRNAADPGPDSSSPCRAC